MMSDTNDSAEAKREELRRKVEEGEARIEARNSASVGERLADMRDDAVEFAREHPLKTVAAGVLLGVAISALFPRSPTRKAARAGTDWLKMAGEMGMLYGARALDAAEDAGIHGLDRVQDMGDAAGAKARRLRRSAAFNAANASDSVGALGRRAQHKAGRSLRDFRRSTGW
jgi:ElaB/YqjD/DUF883 family membrane-anchored ribosome-binding protein